MLKFTKKKTIDLVRVHEDLPVGNISPMDSFVGVEEYVENNRVCKKSIVKDVDARDNFKDYKVSDFFIENLEAAGAMPDNVVQYYDGNVDQVLDYVDRVVDVMEKE